MEHYLNCNKITLEWVEDNYQKIRNIRYMDFQPGKNPFYDYCIENGFLVAHGEQITFTGDVVELGKIIKHLWQLLDVFNDVKFSAVATENKGKEVARFNWSQRGGYADGNFHSVYHESIYRLMEVGNEK